MSFSLYPVKAIVARVFWFPEYHCIKSTKWRHLAEANLLLPRGWLDVGFQNLINHLNLRGKQKEIDANYLSVN